MAGKMCIFFLSSSGKVQIIDAIGCNVEEKNKQSYEWYYDERLSSRFGD